MSLIKVYTRDVIDGQYPNGLAYSVHMVITKDGKETKLNHDYGMLFPTAGINADNVIVPAYITDPRIAKAGGTYYITGIESLADGSADPAMQGKLRVFTTSDFIDYTEEGVSDIACLEKTAGLTISELRAGDSVEIMDELADQLLTYWCPIRFNALEGNTVVYSDGSTHTKDLASYPSLRFPLARGFADPVFLLWEGEYYYIATNDNVKDIGLYVRKAHTLDDLFKPDTPMHLILDKDEKRGLIQTFWAPEFHMIGGDLCILFAVSNETWGPQCHMMKLKKGGDILDPASWSDPVKVKRPGGRPLGENGITLDMTFVRSGSRHYYIWSYREHIGTPLDSGSMIMAGEFDPAKPDELINEPVLLSRPLYGFENVRGTINNEGPYALYHGGKIYLTYSGGDARGYLYTTGLLTAEDGADLCDIKSWTKAKTPVLSFASVPGEYGPGHNSFFTDRNGDCWIAFHAVRSFEEKIISSAARRVHFDAAGRPRFDLAREEDLPEEYRTIK